MIIVTRRSALIGLSTMSGLLAHVAVPAEAQRASPGDAKPNAVEPVELERPAAFEIISQGGSLKETAQKGQELTWHSKGRSIDRRFQLTNISIALLRSETGGQIKMTFSCNISSLGYFLDQAKLNAVLRSKGGGTLYSWSLDVSVQCADKNRPITPLTHELPNDVSANVFANVYTIELSEHIEPDHQGIAAQRCN